MAGGVGDLAPLPKSRIVGLVASVVTAAAGCAGPTEDAPTFSLVDSAGVELARNVGAGVRWLGLQETLRIGEAGGPPGAALFRVGGIHPGPDSTLLVVNDMSSVRVHGPDGAFLRELGRRGPGPGEFSVLTQAVPVDGGILATDIGARRLTLLSPEGDAVWTAGWPGGRGSGGGPLRVDGRVLLEVRRPPEGLGTGELGRVTGEYWEIDPGDGTVSGPVLSIPAGAAMGMPGGLHLPPLLDTTDVHRVAGPDRYVGAVGDGYTVEVRTWSGALVRRVTRDFDPVLVTGDELQRFDEAVREIASRAPGERARLEAARPRVDHIPPVEGVIPVEEGGFWVQRRDLGDDPFGVALAGRLGAGGAARLAGRVFEYFDDGGRYRGSVRLPPGFGPRHWTPGGVVGVLRDELDVERVVRYRFVGEGG